MVAAIRYRAVVLTALVVLLAATPSPSGAAETTTAEFAELVDRSLTDETAVAELRRVDSIDGVPVDMGTILDAPDAERRIRLATLHDTIAATGSPVADPGQLRDSATDILSRPPFTSRPAADSGWLEDIGRFIGNLLSGGAAPGGTLVLLVGATLLLIPAMLWLVRRTSRSHPITPTEQETEEPEDLMAAADRAELDGDWPETLRLLFRSGVADLEERGVVRNGAAASTATIRRLVPDGDGQFLDRFDEVAYGGSRAGQPDVAESRRAWSRLANRWPRS